MSVNLKISKWIMNPVIGLLIAMGTNNSLYSYMALALSACCVIFYNEQDSLCVLFFCMSFAFIFKGAGGGTSFFTMLTLLYVLWNMMRMQRFHLVLGEIMVFWAYVAVVHFANGMMQMMQLLKFATNLLFLYVAVQEVDYHHPKEFVLSYVFGVLTASFLRYSGAYPNVPLYTGEHVDYGRYTGMYSDPNYYGVNLIISLCLIVILYHRKELPAWLTLILAGILVWFCSLTASKMVFLMLLFPTVLFMCSNFKNHRFLLQLVFVGLVAAVVIAVLQGRIEAFDAVLRRFEAVEDAGSLTTGRSDKWQEYLGYIFGNARVALFGEGLNAPYTIASNAVPHNTYIDYLYHLGLVGTVGLFSMLKQIFALSSKKIRRNLMNVSVALCMMVMWMSLSELFYFDYPFHLLLANIVWNVPTEPGCKQLRRFDD